MSHFIAGIRVKIEQQLSLYGAVPSIRPLLSDVPQLSYGTVGAKAVPCCYTQHNYSCGKQNQGKQTKGKQANVWQARSRQAKSRQEEAMECNLPRWSIA